MVPRQIHQNFSEMSHLCAGRLQSCVVPHCSRHKSRRARQNRRNPWSCGSPLKPMVSFTENDQGRPNEHLCTLGRQETAWNTKERKGGRAVFDLAFHTRTKRLAYLPRTTLNK